VVAKRALQLKSWMPSYQAPLFAGFVFNVCKIPTSFKDNEAKVFNQKHPVVD
jgi:hypothetical protein